MVRVEAETDLVERARRDRAAFGQLYDLYVNRVYAFCLSQTGSQDAAEELTAQTFERALRAIERYEQRGAPFSSWLFRIAANLHTDRGRRAGRVMTLGDNPVPEGETGPEDDPARMVEQWERAAWLRAHIAALPEDQQRVIALRYWEGHSTQEMATALDRSENATKQLLYRAVTNLRARLEREGHSV